MEHFGYVIAITSMIVVLFIVTNIYWDSKSNKVYRRFERLLEVAEISHRALMTGLISIAQPILILLIVPWPRPTNPGTPWKAVIH